MTSTSQGIGMLREWKFQIHLLHEQARVKLQYIPQWHASFIDSDEVMDDPRDDHKAKFSKFKPFFAFTDITAAHRTGDHWEEHLKNVVFYYCHLPSGTTLEVFAKRCVQHILRDPQVDSIDGSKKLRKLRIGKKLHCPHKLGGLDSIHFEYYVVNRRDVSNTYGYALGCIAKERGYLITLKCARKEELDAYVKMKCLPHVCDKSKCVLDTPVQYVCRDLSSSSILMRQQELFGELSFMDREAAASFAFPMHPMVMRPDFSPTQTAGTGSLACMTLELEIYQKLCDEFDEHGAAAGMPKHKSNGVILFFEVENVADNNFPPILSMTQYSDIKAKRMLEAFPGMSLVGPPVMETIAGRAAQSFSCTFQYDAEYGKLGGLVKAVLVSTLVGNHGVSVMYFTERARGLFDAHQYLFRQFSQSVKFYDERDLTPAFSRFKTKHVIRLTDQDLPKAYAGTPARAANRMQEHLQCLDRSTDGRVPNAEVFCFTGASPSRRRDSVSDIAGLAQQPSPQLHRRSSVSDIPKPLHEAAEEDEEDLQDNDSIISVEDIPHLNEQYAWEKEGTRDDDEEEDDEEKEGQQGEQRKGSGSGTKEDGQQEGEDNELMVATAQEEEPFEGTTTDMDASQEGSGAGSAGSGRPPTGGRRGSGMETPAGSVGSAGGRKRRPSEVRFDGPPNSSEEKTQQVGGDSRTVSPQQDRQSPSGSAQQHRTSGTPPPRSQSPAKSPQPVLQGEGEDNTDAGKKQQATADIPKALSQEELNEALTRTHNALQGPSLRELYKHCCDVQHCRPNSYLTSKLPENPKFTVTVEELDMSNNYVGHSGFVAILNFLEYLPHVHTVHFNDMSLDNTDIANLCEILATNESVKHVYIRNNTRVTLPSTKNLFRLLKVNPKIVKMSATGTKLGESLVTKLEQEAARNGAAIAKKSEVAEQQTPEKNRSSPARSSQE